MKTLKTDKSLEKKIEEIICIQCFDNSQLIEPLVALFHSYALGIIGDNEYTEGIISNEANNPIFNARNSLRFEQRKKVNAQNS